MPLSDWQPLPVVTTGDLWTAAQHNTYIRQNQQVLRDALALGHGQGSNVDMVDGRHAMPGAYPAVGLLDRVQVIPISNPFEGWVTIGEYPYGGDFFIMVAGTGCCFSARYMVVIADHIESRPQTKITELQAFHGCCSYTRILYIRVLKDPGSQTRWLQIYVRNLYNDTNARYVEIYTVWPGQGIYHSLPVPSTEPPPNATVVGWHRFGNGSWRLVRSLTGTGASAGWQGPSEMQALFPPNNPAGWNPAVLMDGNTSTWYGNQQDAYIRAVSPIPVKSIRVTVHYGYVTGGDTMYVAVRARPGTSGSWNLLGTLNFPSTSTTTRTLTLPTPQMLRDFWLDMYSYETTDVQLTEFQVELAANGIWRGIPLGSRLRLYNSAGVLLEERRNESWTYDAPLLTIADMNAVDRVVITRPDGNTPWLEFPAWVVEGGPFQNGDVLTLYQEA